MIGMGGNQFTDGDKAIIREIAMAVGEHLREQIKGDIAVAVKLHQSDCPGIKGVQSDVGEIKDTIQQLRGAWKVMAAVAALVSAVGTWLADKLMR